MNVITAQDMFPGRTGEPQLCVHLVGIVRRPENSYRQQDHDEGCENDADDQIVIGFLIHPDLSSNVSADRRSDRERPRDNSSK